jgi:hypothetical protein
MSLSKLCIRAILVVVCAALSAVGARAQFHASIQGTILDSKGGAVAGAKVTVMNQATGTTRDTVTSPRRLLPRQRIGTGELHGHCRGRRL